MKKYILTEEQLSYLVEKSITLNNFYSAGIDNWEGFYDADFADEEDIKTEMDDYDFIEE